MSEKAERLAIAPDQAPTPTPRRTGSLVQDALGVLYFVIVTAFFFIKSDLVAALTTEHPYLMGFAKFAFLATFGECLKTRIAAGHWLPSQLILRFLIWGLFGLWITAAFPFGDAGMRGMTAANLWPEAPAAFWKSMWINLIIGYAFFMMFVHYWTDNMLVEGRQWPWEVLGKPGTAHWGKIVFIALLVFWIPAHTVTFMLAPHWRILFAAYLGIALGLILSFAARRA